MMGSWGLIVRMSGAVGHEFFRLQAMIFRVDNQGVSRKRNFMYRSREIRVFQILAVGAHLLLVIAFITAIAHQFVNSSGYLRTIAVFALIFSIFFRLQILMYKVSVMEKRMLHLVEPSMQHFQLASRWPFIEHLIYFALVWLLLIFMVCSMILRP